MLALDLRWSSRCRTADKHAPAARFTRDQEFLIREGAIRVPAPLCHHDHVRHGLVGFRRREAAIKVSARLGGGRARRGILERVVNATDRAGIRPEYPRI